MNILSFLRNSGSALKQPVQLRSQTVAAKIVELFWLFVGKEHNSTEVAAMLVSLYKKVSWKDLVEIDLLFRKNSYYNYSSFLRLGDPVAAFLEGLPKECESVVLRLCTCAPNGYFREKALLAIESLEDELVLPFLLLRLNDWVEPVQQRAKQSLEKRITPKNAHCFIDYYGLVEKARRSQRNCNSAICQNIDQLLRDAPALNYEYLGTANLEPQIRKQLISRILLNRSTETDDIEKIYRSEYEPYIKLKAIEKLLTKDSKVIEYYISLLQVKSSQKCKMLIVEKISSFDFDRIEATLFKALFFKSVAVRRRARELIKAHRKVSFVQIYSDALVSGFSLPVAIVALAEVGAKEDAGKISGLLSSKDPHIRKLALIAVSRLSLTTIEDSIIEYLKDPGAGISSAAKEILTKNRLYVDQAELEKIYLMTESESVRTNCLKILTSGSKWDRIYYIIKYGEFGPDRDYCGRLLRSWNYEYNKSFVAPTNDQIQRIRPPLENSVNYSFDREIQMVKFAIRGFTTVKLGER